MRKEKLVLIVIVLVVLLALEVLLMSRCARQEAPPPAATLEPVSPTMPVTPTPEPTAVPTLEPVYTQPPVTPEPTPEPTAVPTATPESTAEPTATPGPTDQPISGTVSSSGSFSSDTGTVLNMNVKWTAADQGGGTTRIFVTGTLSSYSLQCANLPVEVSMEGGYSTTATGNQIDVPENVQTDTHLFNATLDVPTGTAGNMTVSWRFGGVYSGVSLPTVEASGYVTA